jgi:hypothetical protein
VIAMLEYPYLLGSNFSTLMSCLLIWVRLRP